MTKHARVTDIVTEAATLLALGQPRAARDMIKHALPEAPATPDLVLVLLQSANALRDVATADEAADLLRTLPLSEATLDAMMVHALSIPNVARARALLSEAETTPTLAQWSVFRARARVARAEKDLDAAKAILVNGIERWPDATALRPLLTEVLMESGSASDARDVLSRLGLPPINPPMDGEENLSEDRA